MVQSEELLIKWFLMPKALANSLKTNSNVLWSVSLCQTKDDILEAAGCLITCPQIANITLHIPDTLERFNFLANIIFDLQQGKDIPCLSKEVLTELTSLINLASTKWNDDEIVASLTKIASTKDFYELCSKSADDWMRDNEPSIQLLRESGKGQQIIKWQELTATEAFKQIFSIVLTSTKENPALQRGISGEVSNRMRKYYNQSKGVHRRLIETLSQSYLLEEAAGRIIAGQRSEYEYEIYYGTLTHALIDIYRKCGGNPQTMKTISIVDQEPQLKEQASGKTSPKELSPKNSSSSATPSTSSSFFTLDPNTTELEKTTHSTSAESLGKIRSFSGTHPRSSSSPGCLETAPTSKISTSKPNVRINLPGGISIDFFVGNTKEAVDAVTALQSAGLFGTKQPKAPNSVANLPEIEKSVAFTKK